MGKLLALYIFGSTARGDADDRSDLDILAVVEDQQGTVSIQEVERKLPRHLKNRELSISWYGENRIIEMFDNGELFAWHLYRETVPIFENRAIISELGRPSFYEGGLQDVSSFRKILNGIPFQVDTAPENAVYEMGLIYVCLRNIAMAASWTLRGVPDFSRYSPFELPHVRPVPLSRGEFDMAMRCRLAGQRGLSPPLVAASQVREIHDRIDRWIAELITLLENGLSQ